MPGLRTRSAGAKVTEEEYREIENQAEARGLTVGEWCREVLLAEVERAEAPSAETVLAEVLALRMILLNMMAHTGQGRELSTEQMARWRSSITPADASSPIRRIQPGGWLRWLIPTARPTAAA